MARVQPSERKGKRIRFWWGDRGGESYDGATGASPVHLCACAASRPDGDARLSTSKLFLCRRRVLRRDRRGGRCRRLRLCLRRLHSRKYGCGPGSARRKNLKGDLREHEKDSV